MQRLQDLPRFPRLRLGVVDDVTGTNPRRCATVNRMESYNVHSQLLLVHVAIQLQVVGRGRVSNALLQKLSYKMHMYMYARYFEPIYVQNN